MKGCTLQPLLCCTAQESCALTCMHFRAVSTRKRVDWHFYMYSAATNCAVMCWAVASSAGVLSAPTLCMHLMMVSSEFCRQVKLLSGAPPDTQKALSMITAVCSFLRGLGLSSECTKSYNIMLTNIQYATSLVTSRGSSLPREWLGWLTSWLRDDGVG